MAGYVAASFRNLLAVILESVLYDKYLDRIHIYGTFDHFVEKTFLESLLGHCGHLCCFIGWNCVDVYGVSTLLPSVCLFFSKIGVQITSAHDLFSR